MRKADYDGLLMGHIEADEAYVRGVRPLHKGGKKGPGAVGKTIVFGMKERGGPIATTVVPNVKKETLRKELNERVVRGSTVSTDELVSYGLLNDDGYKHGQVRHNAKQWTATDESGVVHSTNGIEAFWQLFKNSIARRIFTSLRAHGALSRGVHFPVELLPPRERDVRPSGWGALTTRPTNRSNSASSAAATPSASAWAIKSANSVAS